MHDDDDSTEKLEHGLKKDIVSLQSEMNIFNKGRRFSLCLGFSGIPWLISAGVLGGFKTIQNVQYGATSTYVEFIFTFETLFYVTMWIGIISMAAGIIGGVLWIGTAASNGVLHNGSRLINKKMDYKQLMGYDYTGV